MHLSITSPHCQQVRMKKSVANCAVPNFPHKHEWKTFCHRSVFFFKSYIKKAKALTLFRPQSPWEVGWITKHFPILLSQRSQGRHNTKVRRAQRKRQRASGSEWQLTFCGACYVSATILRNFYIFVNPHRCNIKWLLMWASIWRGNTQKGWGVYPGSRSRLEV